MCYPSRKYSILINILSDIPIALKGFNKFSLIIYRSDKNSTLAKIKKCLKTMHSSNSSVEKGSTFSAINIFSQYRKIVEPKLLNNLYILETVL